MNNFNDMMKKAQEMQSKMKEMQESLASLHSFVQGLVCV